MDGTIRFDVVKPNKEWIFWHTWNGKEQAISGLLSEVKIVIDVETEEEARTIFNKFIESIKKLGVIIQ